MQHWRYKNLVWDYEKNKWEWLRKKQPVKNYCQVKGCNQATPLNWRKNKGRPKLVAEPVCSKCKRRRWKYNNPFVHLFAELRRSAFKRKIAFELSYGEFLNFCIENDFYRKSPKFTKDSLTVDREDPEKGYSITNIKIVTQTVNAQRNKAYQQQHSKYTNPAPDNDDPF